jgi:hypothetical protein
MWVKKELAVNLSKVAKGNFNNEQNEQIFLYLAHFIFINIKFALIKFISLSL